MHIQKQHIHIHRTKHKDVHTVIEHSDITVEIITKICTYNDRNTHCLNKSHNDVYTILTLDTGNGSNCMILKQQTKSKIGLTYAALLSRSEQTLSMITMFDKSVSCMS